MTKTPQEYEYELSLVKVHAFYIVVMLVSIIIVSVTIEWGVDDRLVDYINFAATISSLLLAVVAIIYSYYSNSSVSHSLGSLDASASKIVTSTDDLTTATTSLEKKINDIPGFFSGMEKTTGQTLEMVSQLSSALNTSKAATEEVKRPMPEATDHPVFTDRQIDKFLGVASFLGLKVLYAACLAFTQKKDLMMSEFSVNPTQPDYMLGFFLASYAIGLIDYDLIKGVYSVKYLHPRLSSHVKDRLFLVAAESNYAESWIKEIKELEKLFEKKG